MSEQLWARQLKKQKLKTRIPIAKQENNINEQITYHKERLLKALSQNNSAAVEPIFTQLIKLRAQLLLSRLQRMREDGNATGEETLRQETYAYVRESQRLAQALNINLN